MNLELNTQEEQTLRRVLDRYMRELRTEIDHTDAREFREDLRHEAEVLASLKAKLQSREEALTEGFR